MRKLFAGTYRQVLLAGSIGLLSSGALAEPVYCGNGLWYPGGVCPSAAPVLPPVPQGPTPEQKEQMRQEAVDTANNGGIAAYKRGDYALALRYFERALEYSPYNPTIQHNIARAKQMLAAQNGPRVASDPVGPGSDSKAFDELNAIAGKGAVVAPDSAYSGNLGGTGVAQQAGAGFDTATQGARIPFVFIKYLDPHADPIVPPPLETPKLRVLEQQRDKARSEAVKLDKQRTAPAYQPDAAPAPAKPQPQYATAASDIGPADQKDQQPKIADQEKAQLQKVQHLDFSIKKELGGQ